ncbi:GNAT family N-acetyltransferase [Deinococcus yavapaiensis]|uniref:L-amino acid N-acyltransferase YncA n=1 Tax=Deinococcus yavapaiensis KR-236 TaxID=694435 RepID=A0A318S8X4_9DEIO|nr:GNAT family N-acetyltransferase [Deinococcus yavapaiensis]PYE54417.1 L-amino acid N-acyltransferase YncA [Deinococcus yavapaiensis KR-236]
MLTVRSASSADFPALAALLTAEKFGDTTTTDDLRREEALRAPSDFFRRLVLDDDGRLLGTAEAGFDPMSHRPGKFKVNVRVHPAEQGRGFGRALYEALLTELLPLHPEELHVDVRATHGRAVRFARDRGFLEMWRRLDSVLDTPSFDFARFEGLEARVRNAGVEVVSLADLAKVPNVERRLYDLNTSLWHDVPYPEPLGTWTFEQFQAETLKAPSFDPRACLVAVKDDDLVGYSLLLRSGERLQTDMTGVRRDLRGRNVATLLKVRGVRYARDVDVSEIRTTNDTTNVPMLALNAKLGFRPLGSTIRFVRSYR